MGEPAEFDDWEFLHSSESDLALFLASDLKGIEGDPNGSFAIKSDYFALDSSELYARRAASDGDSELTVCGKPGLADPNSDSPKGEMGFGGSDLLHEDTNGFHSSKSSDGLSSLPDCEKGDPVLVEDSKTELGYEGFDAGHCSSDENVALKEAISGETEEIVGSEAGDEKPDKLGSGESVRMEDSTSSSARMSNGRAISESNSSCEGEKRGIFWLKMPLDLLKFCVLRVKPVWSISIAAAIVGIVMMGRRLYKIKRKSQNIPLRVSFNDKKASQFMIRAARLNEAFSVVRRVPVVRFPPPIGGVTPWPVVGLQ